MTVFSKVVKVAATVALTTNGTLLRTQLNNKVGKKSSCCGKKDSDSTDTTTTTGTTAADKCNKSGYKFGLDAAPENWETGSPAPTTACSNQQILYTDAASCAAVDQGTACKNNIKSNQHFENAGCCLDLTQTFNAINDAWCKSVSSAKPYKKANNGDSLTGIPGLSECDGGGKCGECSNKTLNEVTGHLKSHFTAIVDACCQTANPN